MGVLTLPPERVREILEWCTARYPEEACGLLAGNGDVLRVEKVYPIGNVEPSDRTRRYFMDPSGQWKAMRDAERLGLDILGAFHSHTASRAYPSAVDVELAAYPEWVWFIVSLASRDDPEIRAFRIRNSAVEEVQVVVENRRGNPPAPGGRFA